MAARPRGERKPTAGERAKAASDARRTVARNRRAAHDYFIEDRYEAGLSLTGTEVKALRMGRASLTEAWIEIDRRAELERLAVKVRAKGYTIVPLELYFIGGRAKLEIALARGKQDWDKRQALREAQDRREAARAVAAANRRRG